jgi:L-seryl-tRNA selenium transferase/selenocysteine synthase-like protein
MQIKPPEILNRLPSVSDLLEKPPIKALTERWNRSVVAGGVRSFLDELRSDFERRTAALPSIRELAERAARYVVSRQHRDLDVAINATGVISGPPWTAAPLAEVALERMLACGREFVLDSSAEAERAAAGLCALISRLTSAPSAAVIHSYATAIWLARECEAGSIAELDAAPLVDPPATIGCPWPSAQSVIASGSQLAIIRGDGLIGGPAAGIILGNQAIVSRITEHPRFASLQLDSHRVAALTATLECYDTAARGTDELPVWQLLATSVDNLRNRAERLAAQLAHVEGVLAATAIETRSPILAATSGDAWPSYGVALAAADNNVAALDKRCRSARFPVVGRIEGERLVIDLRTVLPRQDKAIVDSLLGESPKSPTT